MLTSTPRSLRSFALAITATVALVVGLFVGVAPAQAAGATAQVVTITGTCGTTGQYGDTCVLIGNSKYNGPFPTGLPVAISVDPTSAGICTVTQTQATAPTRYNLTYNALGTCLVNATQAGDATYAAATPVPKSITVGTKALNISLDSLVTAYVGDTFSFTPTVTGLVGTDSISGITATYGALGSYAGGTTPPTAEGLYTVTPSGATFTSGSASNYSITYGSASYLCLAPVSARGTFGMCIEKVTTSPAARTISFGLVNYTSGTVNSGTTIRAASYIKMPSSAQSTVSCTLTGTSGNMSMSYPGASGSGGGGSFSSSFSVSRSNNSGLLWVSLAFSSAASTGKVMCNWDGTGATVGSASYFSSVLGPSITSISPTSGASSGGTTIIVTGTKLMAGATVTVGGVPCTNVVIVPTTSLTCVTPAGAPGAVDVVVTNTDGTTVTSTGGFTQAVTVKPANSVAPAVSPTGAVAQGATLTSTPGTWDYQGDPTTATVTQWQVCSTSNASSCVNIAGSTGETLVAGLPVAGQYVRTAVAATNDAGTTTVYSNIVGPVDKIAQTITFADPADALWSATPVALVGSSSSSLALTFTSTTPTVCSVNGSSVTMVGAGTCSVTASQAGTVAYSAATPVTQTFEITQATQTITFADPADRLYSATPFTLTASSSSTLPVTVTSSTTAVCSVTGLSVRMISAGTCTLTATQAGNTGVAAATPITQSFDVTQATQTITFADPADRTYSATPFTVTATSSSSLPVTVTSTTTGVCTVVGVTVTMKAAGTCALTASQAGNTGTSAATPITQDFVISKADQTLVLSPSSAANLNSGATQALAVTGKTGTGAVTYVATPSGPGVTCVITGTILKGTGAGTCSVVASVASDPFVNGDSSDPVVFTINGANAVTFAAITDKLLTAGSLTVAPVSSARLPVTLTSSTPSVCTVTGLVITFVDSGLCTTVANQPGDATHFAATAVTRSFNVAAAPDAPVVDAVSTAGSDGLPGGSALVSFTPGDINGSVISGYKVIATAPDGTTVTLPCTLSPCTVPGLMPATPYVFTVTTVATAAGTPAPAVSAPSAPATPATAQVITFVSPGDVRPGVSSFTVAPTSSVSSAFVPTVTSSTPSVCTVSNSVVTVVTSGVCTLAAAHPGGTFENAPYGSASTSVTFNVTAAVPVVTTTAILPAAVVGAPITAVSQTFTRGTAIIPATAAWKAVGLPTGLTINPNTGVISGTPSTEGLFSQIVVSLTDAGRLTGSKTLSMSIVAPPTLTAESKLVLAANAAVPAGTSFPAVQGTSSSLTWSESGLSAVAGLSMSTEGVLSGTPTTPGTYRVTVSVTDGNSLSSSKVITVTVVAPPQVTTAVTAYSALEGRALTPIVNTSLKGAAAIPATGAWTSANLPAGLRLDPDKGTITGSPEAAGSYTFTVTLTDANGISASKTITLTVGNPPVIETRRVLPTFTLGGSAMPDITQIVTPGAAAIPTTGAWALKAGQSLPAGLALNPDTGAITGSPTTAGNYTFTVVLTDGAGLTDTAVYKLSVVAANTNKTVLNLPLDVADGVQVSTATYALDGAGESSLNLAITYSTTPASDAVCFLDSQNKINIIGAGTCTVTASSGTGAQLSTATQSFVVSKTPQEVTVTAPGSPIPDSDPAENAAAATDDPSGFQLSASASSGLALVYTVIPAKDAAGKAMSPNCKVDDTGIVTWLYDLTLVPGKNGYSRSGDTCRVMVSQPGDKNFDAVKPVYMDLVATHNSNPVAPGGVVADRRAVKIPRKGGTFTGTQDSLTFAVTKTSVTAKPGSRGGYTGPIKATITVPYKVTVNGVQESRTQSCVINYGTTKKMKPTDPLAFSWKVFSTTMVCKFNAEAFAYFSAGNAVVGITFVVERDRRFSTTYLKIDPGNGKQKPFTIVPTKRQYTLNLG